MRRRGDRDRDADRRRVVTVPVNEPMPVERIRARLDEVLEIDALLDQAVRDCAGPPPHGASLARRVSRYARRVWFLRTDLAALPVPEDLRSALDTHLRYRQLMLEQALALVFSTRTAPAERIRLGLAEGLGPRARGLSDVVAMTSTALDVAGLPEA